MLLLLMKEKQLLITETRLGTEPLDQKNHYQQSVSHQAPVSPLFFQCLKRYFNKETHPLLVLGRSKGLLLVLMVVLKI